MNGLRVAGRGATRGRECEGWEPCAFFLRGRAAYTVPEVCAQSRETERKKMPGLGGRPRKPTSLRIIDGNRGKRALPKKEPRPARGKPELPAHVKSDRFAAEEWRRLVELGSAPEFAVLTRADGPILEATVLAYSVFRVASLALAKGLTYKCKTASGATMVRTHPEVAIASEAWRRYLTGLSHLGLSPATRGKVSASPDGSPPDGSAEFLD